MKRQTGAQSAPRLQKKSILEKHNQYNKRTAFFRTLFCPYQKNMLKRLHSMQRCNTACNLQVKTLYYS
jgi:hypothetical protein